jgi:S1-C subfamily serine protease
LAQDREAPHSARWRARLGAPAPAAMSRRQPALSPGSAPALDTPALRARLERSSAIVLGMGAAQPQSLVNGSAFFISPTLLITNRHVVEGIRPDTLLVTGSAFGQVRRAEIVAMSPAGGPGGPDFALLRLLSGAAPGVAPITIAADKLTPVIAAGYPGITLMSDRGFKDLIAGDAGAAPDLNMNRGEIRSIRKLGRITRIIHTADVLPGYSGGPLMDLCGRVAGVNTFIQVDRDKGSKLNNALSGADLAAFLRSAGVGARIDDRPCIAQ